MMIHNEKSGQIPMGHPHQQVDGYLSKKLEAALEELCRQARQTDGSRMPEATYARLKYFRQLRSALASLSQGQAGDSLYFAYLISAPFLRDAHLVLTKTRDEHLVYATGPDDGNRMCALTKLVTFDLAQQGVAHAAPELTSQLLALRQLDKNEERLLATFHSHPGNGARATTPSSVDMSTQRGLEKNGYPAIGVVFSRDGYVRFYSANRLFRVTVSGAGVKQVDDCLFHITDIKARSMHRDSDPKSMIRIINSRAKSFFARRSI